MSVLAYMPLHTGLPWLYETLHQILPQVDKLVILYTPTPSCGYTTLLPCPDLREDLFKIAEHFGNEYAGKLVWVDGRWSNEHDHCDAIWDFADGYDYVLRVDADEVYPDGFMAEMVRQADAYPEVGSFRFPFLHFWKDLEHVCRDFHPPYRMLRNPRMGDWMALDSKSQWFVYHMGYAQPTEYIAYKLSVSYHKPEFRKDWFQEKWLKKADKDLHPVTPGIWDAEEFDRSTLPDVCAVNPLYLGL